MLLVVLCMALIGRVRERVMCFIPCRCTVHSWVRRATSPAQQGTARSWHGQILIAPAGKPAEVGGADAGVVMREQAGARMRVAVREIVQASKSMKLR